MDAWSDAEVSQLLVDVAILKASLNFLGPWVIAAGLGVCMVAGLQLFWLLLRGKDGKRFW